MDWKVQVPVFVSIITTSAAIGWWLGQPGATRSHFVRSFAGGPERAPEDPAVVRSATVRPDATSSDAISSRDERDAPPIPDSEIDIHGVPPGSRSATLPSLEDREIADGLEVGADGHFVPTSDTLEMFDRWFEERGEEPRDVIRGRIVIEIIGRLAPPADGEAIDALDRYIAYRDVVAEREADGSMPSDPVELALEREELQREHFGRSIADARRGRDEQVVVIDLGRGSEQLAESRDTAQQRGEGDEPARKGSPTPVTEAEERAKESARTPRETHESKPSKEEGGSGSAAFDLWAARYGGGAGAQHGAGEERQADWRQRFAEYRVERDALIAHAGDVSPAQREAQLERLRARHFSRSELSRIREIDDEKLRGAE